MAEAHLDADMAGEVRWFPGKGPAQIVGKCQHSCDHRTTDVIAWGPDYDHYCLIECSQCHCRSWTAEYPEPWSKSRPKYRDQGFREVLGTEIALEGATRAVEDTQAPKAPARYLGHATKSQKGTQP